MEELLSDMSPENSLYLWSFLHVLFTYQSSEERVSDRFQSISHTKLQPCYLLLLVRILGRLEMPTSISCLSLCLGHFNDFCTYSISFLQIASSSSCEKLTDRAFCSICQLLTDSFNVSPGERNLTESSLKNLLSTLCKVQPSIVQVSICLFFFLDVYCSNWCSNFLLW